MRKKLFAVALTVALLVMLALSACGGDIATSESPPESSETATNPAELDTPIESETTVDVEPGAPSRDIVALAAEIEFDPDNYTDIILDVPYMDDGEDYHLLDLYGTQSYDGVKPTVIEIHGGGFIGGTRGNNSGHSIFYAERGYKVVVPDYGKVPRHGDFKDAIQDLFSAFHWVEENADAYGFDLNNIFLSGDSAGGYYTLLCCAIFHSGELQEYFGVTLPDFKFATYVTTCPAADYRDLRSHLQDESGPKAHMAQSVGEELLMDDDLMDHMDLMMNVEPEAFAGIYMMTTPTDTMTGEEVQTFDAYLTEQGIEHTTLSYDGVENDIIHTFNISHADYAESKVANQDMVDYLDAHLK